MGQTPALASAAGSSAGGCQVPRLGCGRKKSSSNLESRLENLCNSGSSWPRWFLTVYDFWVKRTSGYLTLRYVSLSLYIPCICSHETWSQNPWSWSLSARQGTTDFIYPKATYFCGCLLASLIKDVLLFICKTIWITLLSKQHWRKAALGVIKSVLGFKFIICRPWNQQMLTTFSDITGNHAKL